jgi:cell division septum initiation protein DivIVA
VTDATYSSERMTPQQVRSATFPAARLGRRGVDESAVREFCEQVEGEMVRLLNERTQLSNEVERLLDRIRAPRGTTGVTPDEGHAQAVRILSSAQQAADRYVADAQAYSRDLAEDARRHREEILADAQSNASAILSDAHARATAAADRVPVHREPIDDSERRALESELAYLRTYSDVCRTHLRAYLDSLARSLEEWEQAERKDLPFRNSPVTR